MFAMDREDDALSDPYRLERFVAAQDQGGTYGRAVAELHAGALILRRPQSRTRNADFAPGQRQYRRHGLDMRSAIRAFLAEDTIGKSHEEYSHYFRRPISEDPILEH